MPWLDDATTDEAAIFAFWKRSPAAMAGWRLPEGLAIVDVDDAKALEASGLELPPAPEQRGTLTRPDGLHRLYRIDEGRQTQGELPGMDTRVGGLGWVALYGPDAFAGDPPAAPPWFPRGRSGPPDRPFVVVTEASVARTAIASGQLWVPAGKRDGDLASIAGTLIAQGATAESVRTTLNLLDAAGVIEQPTGDRVDDGDFARIAHSVAKGHARRHPLSPDVDAEADPDLGICSWLDLMAEPDAPVEMIRAGVPKVGVTVAAAPPKTGKTLFAGQTAIESGLRSLLIVEEGSKPALSYRLRTQAAALGRTDPPIDLMHRKRIRLDERGWVRRLVQGVRRGGYELVVIDPLNRAHSADENRPTEMTRVMDGLAELAYELAIAVLAIHHLNKPSAERRGDPWDRFRGASSIRSGTDANLILDASGDRVHLLGEFRDAEPLSEWLELDRESLIFRPSDAPEAPAKVDPIGLRAYVQDRAQVTGQQVAAEFKVSKNTAFAALRAIGCDEYAGVRGRLTFSLGTDQ